MQRFWMQSFPDPGRRRIKWRPADRVGYETNTGVPVHADNSRWKNSAVKAPKRLFMHGCKIRVIGSYWLKEEPTVTMVDPFIRY